MKCGFETTWPRPGGSFQTNIYPKSSSVRDRSKPYSALHVEELIPVQSCAKAGCNGKLPRLGSPIVKTPEKACSTTTDLRA